MPSSASTRPSGVFTSGLTSTSVASSLTKTSHSLVMIVDRLVEHLVGEAGGDGDLARLGRVHALERVDGDLRERLGALHRELLDLHAALTGGHGEEGAVRAVEQEGEVVLLRDVAGLGDEHPVGDVALDVQAEDRLGLGAGVGGVVGELDAAGLAAAAGLHLGLDDDLGAEALGCRAAPRRGWWRRSRGSPARHGRRRDPSPGTRTGPRLVRPREAEMGAHDGVDPYGVSRPLTRQVRCLSVPRNRRWPEIGSIGRRAAPRRRVGGSAAGAATRTRARRCSRGSSSRHAASWCPG